MVQRTHKWCRVAWNGSALCRIIQHTHKWCSVISNNFAEHQTFYLNIKLLSITRNISMLRRIVELARRNHQKYKRQMEQWSAGGHDFTEWEDCRETITLCSRYVEESSIRLAVKQSQFSEFLLFFPCRYCIYSLSFMKALIKIATRLDSTTVCRPPGLPQFARVGEPECS